MRKYSASGRMECRMKYFISNIKDLALLLLSEITLFMSIFSSINDAGGDDESHR